LTKIIEKILAEDDGESLQKRVAELEAENSRLTTVAAQSSETIPKMLRSLDSGVEDYNLLMAGNERLLAERNDLCHHTEDLESELAKVRAAATADVAALEVKVTSAEAHSVDVVATSENV
jgi:cell division protein FtsB